MSNLKHINDPKKYERYLKAVGSLSGLFSDNPRPLINYRTAEKLFNMQSGAKDVGRQDGSFDSRLQDSNGQTIGVGVKTFTANSSKDSSTEKIAEFSKPAFVKILGPLSGVDLAVSVSELRNKRVTSDALQLGVDLTSSYYHCVVRVPGAVVLHEEPYELVDISNIFPTDARGRQVNEWPTGLDGHVYFGDGLNLYTFLRGKNVLQKRFNLSKGFTSPPIKIGILSDAFEKIVAAFGVSSLADLASEIGSISPTSSTNWPKDRVILPLYSPGKMTVHEGSGINSWNAGGRPRKFGEAYVPIPALVHKIKPGFFPPRDQKFSMALPNGEVISAKVCQQGSKALMSDPNTAICFWLYELIDGDIETAKVRAKTGTPYSYDDLIKIGKDAVSVTKSNSNGIDYELELVSIGEYEAFVDGTIPEED
jgi:hypothetical protein